MCPNFYLFKKKLVTFCYKLYLRYLFYNKNWLFQRKNSEWPQVHIFFIHFINFYLVNDYCMFISVIGVLFLVNFFSIIYENSILSSGYGI